MSIIFEDRRALRLLSERDARVAAASLDKLSRTLYNTAVSKLINQSNNRKQQMHLVGRISIAWFLYIFINNLQRQQPTPKIVHYLRVYQRYQVYPIRGTVFGWLTPHQLRGSFDGGGGGGGGGGGDH
ncbi:hypothetical protein T4B_5662 [Trichinella pseudospiralis]|uniref:Uncharacterized protein n=1 Tax=Trichinella pseudospiralis TaxID=6337 RepID=A0A0V1IHR4_TRIPS|nr:hypothetical protein T4B_5662 [Trichinella pseudospiralis]